MWSRHVNLRLLYFQRVVVWMMKHLKVIIKLQRVRSSSADPKLVAKQLDYGVAKELLLMACTSGNFRKCLVCLVCYAVDLLAFQ